MKRGWIDYVIPQLYWHIGFAPADHELLLNWWSEWRYARNMYVGHAIYKIATDSQEAWDNPSELPRQIRLNRQTDGSTGSAHFSTSKLLNNQLGIIDSLRYQYQYFSKIPEMIWLNTPIVMPVKPISIKNEGNGNLLQ